MIMSRDDIKMNFEKMKAIVEWEKSTHLKKIQAFLKFVNFYKRFIKNFFQIVKSFKTHQKRSAIFMIEEVSKSIRWIEKTSHRSISSFLFLIRIENVFKVRLIRLRISRSFISKREWWFD
jgi:hypothetical protein